jgi:hypothetical protein
VAVRQSQETAEAHNSIGDPTRHLLDQQMVYLTNGLIARAINLRSLNILTSRLSGCAVAFAMGNLQRFVVSDNKATMRAFQIAWKLASLHSFAVLAIDPCLDSV